MKNIKIDDKKLIFPVFMPDATKGSIQGLDTYDLKSVNVEGLIVNTYHLEREVGKKQMTKNGGIKKFMNWDGFVISDSGGFQLLSLLDNDRDKAVDKEGFIFKDSKGRKNRFTPEDSINMQFAIDPDIMIAFDDCPAIDASHEQVIESVDRTIEWAKRSREAYDKYEAYEKPLLFGVVQGGSYNEERHRCIEALEDIGFDGYGFGGWPLDPEGNIDMVTLEYTASIMPDDKPKYALGVGNPQAVLDSFKVGYDIFDCVLPTRDGRNGRLYLYNSHLNKENITYSQNVYKHAHILDSRYKDLDEPIDESCDCMTCNTYSAAYLHHLFKVEDPLAGRLATIHNLRTYTRLIEVLRDVKR